MARFLHIADVHLGIKRYNLPDRTGDFFRAWQEVIERYAIGRRVDFVLIAGDLFDRRNVDPQAANHAMIMLRRLEQERIPVLVIEGNHDSRESLSRHSWLRSFSQWRYMKLLEPEWDGGIPSLKAWNEEEARGAYIDIGDARIFGSIWLGTTVGQALPLLGEAVRQNRRSDATNIMLLHSDVEGQLNRPIQNALSISKLVALRESVDYLALGHTHKRFGIEEWAFNPGSLEACSVDEADTERGAYLVETDGPVIKVEFFRAGADYFQRPFRRLEHQIKGQDDPEAVRAEVFEVLRAHCSTAPGEADAERPIIELTLRGQLAFKNSLLRLDKLKEQAIDEFQPLGLIINNKTIPKQLAVAVDLARDAPRSVREMRVIEDIIKPDPRFGHRASELAAIVVEAKRLALEGESPEKILRLIEDRLFQATTSEDGQASPEAVCAEGAG
ncbi:MAG TPA: exonuclease SbcCD subunit D [Blastocatellia bacterium]|nr:exonuclease SbcCD subunit D [Blastocatellia bacterium]